MKKRDIIIVVVLLVVALGVYLAVTLLGGNNANTGYVSVIVNNREWVKLPVEEPTTYTVHQSNGNENTITIDEGGVVYVSESNCSNQDCVNQGTVSTDTLEFRPLGGQIICLPHKLVVELIPDGQLGNTIILEDIGQ